ncbi:MAG: ABC transporter permease [Desulfomonilaceae bacterium]|nr:ABC transporter permease [Desulfomonilaceae bacterium]
MKPFRGSRIAIKSLTAHRLRVILALLAVSIGVAAVIIMVGIGKGAERAVMEQIQGMGSNLLIVSAGPSRALMGKEGTLSIVTNLTLKDAVAIEQECDAVKRAAPVHWKKLPVKYENVSYTTKIVGTLPLFRMVRNHSIRSGSFFGEDENKSMARVAVVGPAVVQSLFSGRDPVGESMRIGRVSFRVIGVTGSKGEIQGEDEDDQIFIPLRTALSRLMNVTHLTNIYVEAKSFEDIRKAEDQIGRLLRERHRLRGGQEDDFTIRNQADVIEAESAIARTFSLLVSGIALISLLIGGVGILGVMLLSVRERVEEIGIRRAVGARKRDILVQFLVESSFMGIVGGLLGLLLGVIAGQAIGKTSGMTVALVPEYMAASLAFSVAVGMIFGIYPAWKAAQLDPIQALRT